MTCFFQKQVARDAFQNAILRVVVASEIDFRSPQPKLHAQIWSLCITLHAGAENDVTLNTLPFTRMAPLLVEDF